MKTIALFGASGQTGQQFLSQALSKGYKVIALARNPQSIPQQSPLLELIKGDVLNKADVEKTVERANIVVSLFGHVKGSPEWLQTNGTKNIVGAMKKYSVARIISLSGGGLPFPSQDRPKLMDKFIRLMMRIFAKKILNDAIEHHKVLENSGLAWSIVRGPMLTNGAKLGKYRVGWVGVNGSTKISRADLADFILELVENDKFDYQMPFVSY